MTELVRPLPQNIQEFSGWDWERIEPYYTRLNETPLYPHTLNAWLADWSQLSALMDERYQRLQLATTQNTADEELIAQFNDFVENIYPRYQAAEQSLKEHLIASSLQPEGFSIPLRNLRAEAQIFRQENLPLLTQEQKHEKEYDQLLGSETVLWEGQTRTPAQMLPIYQDANRATRERAWRLVMSKRLENRAALNDLWTRMLRVRIEMATNAGFTLPNGMGDYRAFRWQQYLRFDYTPEDARHFNQAIQEVVVPAAARLYDKYRQKLGVETLRPWDLQGPQGFFTSANLPGENPLRPYRTESELNEKSAAIFRALDPELGAMFDRMVTEDLLDLSNRQAKAPGGYCMSLEHSKRAFIFMNAVGTHEDVQTLLHEAGHAFHAFEMFDLPYIHQRAVPLEFCEVASIGMEFLTAPYLNQPGGFYANDEAPRARIEKYETSLLFWPYMAVVDEFQHWVYANPQAAMDPENCDARWGDLWERYMQGVDWSGLEEERLTGWHRKLHIFTGPFYYIEYGMAQLGAAQVWANSLRDPGGAVRDYRRALALGATEPLPVLFETCGAKFKFDAPTLREAVELMEDEIKRLEE